MIFAKKLQVGAVVGMLATSLVFLSGCVNQNPLEGKFVFPIVWSVVSPPGETLLPSSRVTLNEDGTAVLSDFPLGAWDAESEPGCINFEGELVSGAADWEFLSEGKMLLSTAEGAITLYADSGLFGSVGWIDFYVYKCDGTKFSFGVDSAIILPTPG